MPPRMALLPPERLVVDPQHPQFSTPGDHMVNTQLLAIANKLPFMALKCFWENLKRLSLLVLTHPLAVLQALKTTMRDRHSKPSFTTFSDRNMPAFLSFSEMHLSSVNTDVDPPLTQPMPNISNLWSVSLNASSSGSSLSTIP
jgi:hypothetical protein